MVMRPMANAMAKTVRTIWAMWTRNFKLSSNDLMEDSMVGEFVDCSYVIVCFMVQRFGAKKRMEGLSLEKSVGKWFDGGLAVDSSTVVYLYIRLCLRTYVHCVFLRTRRASCSGISAKEEMGKARENASLGFQPLVLKHWKNGALFLAKSQPPWLSNAKAERMQQQLWPHASHRERHPDNVSPYHMLRSLGQS